MKRTYTTYSILLLTIITIVGCTQFNNPESDEFFSTGERIFKDNQIYCTIQLKHYEDLYEYNKGFGFFAVDINNGIVYDTVIECCNIWPHLCKTNSNVYISNTFGDQYGYMTNVRFNIQTKTITNLTDSTGNEYLNIEKSPDENEIIYTVLGSNGIIYYSSNTNVNKVFKDTHLLNRFYVNWQRREIVFLEDNYQGIRLGLINIDNEDINYYTIIGKEVEGNIIQDISYANWLGDSITAKVTYTNNLNGAILVQMRDTILLIDTIRVNMVNGQTNGYYCKIQHESIGIYLYIFDNNNNLINTIYLK